MCVSPVWGSPSAETLAKLPSTVVCTVSNDDGGMLRERLARGEQPRVTLHAEVDTGWRKTPILVADLDGPRRGRTVHPVLRPSRHLVLRRDGQRRGQRNDAGSGAAAGARRGSLAARAAAVLLVGPLARALFRLHLVCRPALGRTGTTLRRARECQFHRRHRRDGGEPHRRPRPSLPALAAEAIGAQAGPEVCRQAHVALVGPVVLGHRHSRDVWRAERAAAVAGEDAQRAGLVVAHAARHARQDRRGEPGARHQGLCAHAAAAADRSGAAAGFRRPRGGRCWRSLRRCATRWANVSISAA